MRLPHVKDLHEVDVAVVGIPSDGAQVFRSGSRFGPEAIRSASVMLRNYNPILGRRRLRAPLARRLRGRAHGSRLDRRLPRAVGRRPSTRSQRAGSGHARPRRRPHGAPRRATRARCVSTVRLPSCSWTPTTMSGTSTSARSSSTEAWSGGRRRRASSTPARSVQAGMRGSLTAKDGRGAPGGARLRSAPVRGAGGARAGGLRRSGASPSRRRTVLPVLRRRLRRPGVRTGNRHP